MKKYRLIREYPGSPELGTIITQTNGYGMTYIEAHKYPEFWEEIVEKDYEILSIIIPSYNQICEKEGDYFVAKKGGIKPFILGTYIDYKIHSVKRLSDGEVFTVGDRIQYYNITGEKSHTYVISDITIYEDEILLNHNHGTWKSHADFKKVQKVKQPLFTTEDNVDIFEGDKVSTVSLSTMELFTIDGLVGYCTSPAKGFKYFSTKEKAEEYILMNKPCLSVKDILKRFNSKWSEVNETTLKELVKSKILKL